MKTTFSYFPGMFKNPAPAKYYFWKFEISTVYIIRLQRYKGKTNWVRGKKKFNTFHPDEQDQAGKVNIKHWGSKMTDLFTLW